MTERTERPALSRGLNQLILHFAPKYEARADVPEVCGGTPIAEFSAFVRHRGIMTVWDGASAGTIYADPKVNHAFRAWHDATHIRDNCGFTLEGETRACAGQIADILQVFPRVPAYVLALIRAEIIGQTEYFATNGAFPTDQYEFTRHAAEEAL